MHPVVRRSARILCAPRFGEKAGCAMRDGPGCFGAGVVDVLRFVVSLGLTVA